MAWRLGTRGAALIPGDCSWTPNSLDTQTQMHFCATMAMMFALGTSADARDPQPNLVFVLVVSAHISLAVVTAAGRQIRTVSRLRGDAWRHRRRLFCC